MTDDARQNLQSMAKVEVQPEPNLAQAYGVNLAADIYAVPLSFIDRDRNAFAITNDIVSFFEQRLTKADLALWKVGICQEPNCTNNHHPHEKLSSDDRHRLYSTLDHTIMDRARQLGPIIYFSYLVLDRMFVWRLDPDRGATLTDELGRSVTFACKFFQHKAKYHVKDLPPGLKATRVQTLDDLKRLLRQHREHRRAQRLGRSTPSYEDTCKWLQDRIEQGSHHEFPALYLSRQNFYQFLDRLEPGNGLRIDITQSQVRPAQLVDTWFGARLGLSQETFRRAVSRSAKV